jgi:5-methylcytosine-specific restriction endonuclease McrA
MKISFVLILLLILSISWSTQTYDYINKLNALEVRTEDCQISYVRDEWNYDKIDEDNDGLYTREEVLLRDNLIKNGDGGKWICPYTGETITGASEIQIDHVVPLENAHISGGCHWSAEKKQSFANYLGNNYHLLPVSKTANRSKGSKSPNEWWPSNQHFFDDYIRYWIEIKSEWGLSVTRKEMEFLNKWLSSNQHFFDDYLKYWIEINSE